MKDTESLKRELGVITRLLERRRSQIDDHAEVVQGAMTVACVQAMLACKEGAPESDVFNGDSSTAGRLRRLAGFGSEKWAAPLLEKADAIEEIETTLECLSAFKLLLHYEPWRQQCLMEATSEILAASKALHSDVVALVEVIDEISGQIDTVPTRKLLKRVFFAIETCEERGLK